MDRENNDVFKNYLKEKPKFSERLKQPRFWAILVIVLVGIFLAVQFYLINVKSLSTEELKAAIEIVWSDSQWVNKEVTPYGVTIVPSFSFKIKNRGVKPLQYLKFIGIFLFAENDQQFSDGFLTTFRDPLDPGETSEEIFMKAFNGYKASSKESFLRNPEGWKKVKVKLFAGTSDTPALLGIFPINQLIEGIDDKNMAAVQSEDGKKQESTDQLQKSVQIIWQDSSWIYKDHTASEIVLVPTIRIKIKNLGNFPLRYISFKGFFEVESTGKPFSQGTTIALEDPLASKMTSNEIEIRAEYGYTVSSVNTLEKNKMMMENIKVRLFAKIKESDDVLLGIFPIKGVIKAKK